MTARKITPESVNCPKCKTGVLFDVTSKLAVSLGHKQVKCDKCGYRHGFRIWKAPEVSA